MPDGRITYSCRGHATRKRNRRVDFVGAVMDVTSRKETEYRIRFAQCRTRAAGSGCACGEMEGGRASRRRHRTRLHNFLARFAYGEMIFEETPADSPLKRYAKRAHRRDSGRRLVEPILAFIRSQLGKRLPVAVTHVVAETLELLRVRLSARPTSFRIERRRCCLSS